MLDEALAFKLAARLTLIRGFVNRQDAIEAAAEELLEICSESVQLGDETWDPERQARWLIRELTGEPGEWQGLFQLRATHRTKFRPIAEHQTLPELPAPEVPECDTCKDWGFYARDGVTVWCTCARAAAVKRDTPNLLEAFNRKRMKPIPKPLPPEKRITEADIERELRRRNAPERKANIQ